MEQMLASYESVPAIKELNTELKVIYATVNERLATELRELLNV